jgi:hypothetical protein
MHEQLVKFHAKGFAKVIAALCQFTLLFGRSMCTETVRYEMKQ